MKEEFQPINEPYLDYETKLVFEEVGKGFNISRNTLAALGQVHRSPEGCRKFKELTGVSIASRDDLKALFESVRHGQINLIRVLAAPSLEKYVNRRTAYNMD